MLARWITRPRVANESVRCCGLDIIFLWFFQISTCTLRIAFVRLIKSQKQTDVKNTKCNAEKMDFSATVSSKICPHRPLPND